MIQGSLDDTCKFSQYRIVQRIQGSLDDSG